MNDDKTDQKNMKEFPHTLSSSGGENNVSVMTLGDLELSTIEKQQRELKILLAELKDRDRELNMMVATHQHHLSSWDRDRHRAMDMERRSERFEFELKKRSEQVRQLIHHIKLFDSKHKSTVHALELAVARIKQLEKDASITSSEAQDLKDKNASLNDSISDLSTKIDGMESREQKLHTALQLKEKDICETTHYAASLQRKIGALEAQIQENKRKEDMTQSDIKYEKTRCNNIKSENECLKRELRDIKNDFRSCRCEMSKLEEKVKALQHNLSIKDDEISRKDELISSHKSKQDRTDKEFTALHMVYERQLEDMLAMQSNLEALQDAKQPEYDNKLGDTSEFEDCKSDATEEILEEARRSTLADEMNFEEQDVSSQKSQTTTFDVPSTQKLHSSPTSKLQKLLEESREMVHNLELATKAPLHLSSSTG